MFIKTEESEKKNAFVEEVVCSVCGAKAYDFHVYVPEASFTADAYMYHTGSDRFNFKPRHVIITVCPLEQLDEHPLLEQDILFKERKEKTKKGLQKLQENNSDLWDKRKAGLVMSRNAVKVANEVLNQHPIQKCINHPAVTRIRVGPINLDGCRSYIRELTEKALANLAI